MVQYEWNEDLCRTYADGLRPVVKFDHGKWAKRIASKFKQSAKSMIDIASGPGFLLFETAKIFPLQELCVQDAEPNMLKIAKEEAKRYGKDAKTTNNSADALTIEPNQYDIVSCKQLLHQAENPLGVISEMHRICKPGGQVFLIDFNKDSGMLAALFVRTVLRLIRGKIFAQSFWKSYKNGLKGKDAASFFQETGFKKVEYREIQYNYLIFGEK